MTNRDEIELEAASRLLTRDRVTLKFTDPETGAVLGRIRFTVTERDETGLPVRIAQEQLPTGEG